MKIRRCRSTPLSGPLVAGGQKNSNRRVSLAGPSDRGSGLCLTTLAFKLGCHEQSTPVVAEKENGQAKKSRASPASSFRPGLITWRRRQPVQRLRPSCQPCGASCGQPSWRVPKRHRPKRRLERTSPRRKRTGRRQRSETWSWWYPEWSGSRSARLPEAGPAVARLVSTTGDIDDWLTLRNEKGDWRNMSSRYAVASNSDPSTSSCTCRVRRFAL